MKSLREILGIDLPVIQAPMAGVQKSGLATTVSNAGGLGSLPCAMLSHEEMRVELQALKSGTPKPFNVNFFCHEQPTPDPVREAEWLRILLPYYRELGVDPNDQPSATTRGAFDEAAAEILAEFQPPVVSFHFGLPSPGFTARIREWGAKILSSATTVQEAIWLEAHGADLVIAQGVEAGGHRGMFLTRDITTQVGTIALVRQIVRAVRIPVIAAGGIADAEGVAAALQLGAAGVQIGTAYLLCPEATTSPLHRAALKSEPTRHTALTNVFTGRAARSVVNRLMRDIGPINPAAPEFPLASTALLPLRKAAETAGSSDFSSLWAGQNAAGCREIEAASLTRELCRLIM